MKMKKLLAMALSAAMVVTSVIVPTGPGATVLAATAATVTTTTWMSANSGEESLTGDFDVTYSYHEKGGEFSRAAVVEVRDATHYIDIQSDNNGAIGTLVKTSSKDEETSGVEETSEAEETEWQKVIFHGNTLSNVQYGNTWWPSADKLAEYEMGNDGWGLFAKVRASETGVEASAHVVRTGNKFVFDIAERDAKDLELLVVWHYEVELELAKDTTITLSAGENCELTNISFKNNKNDAADTATGLVGYYPFDESLTNFVSSTEGTAKLHGGADIGTDKIFVEPAKGEENYDDGKSGKAYKFLGDEYTVTTNEEGNPVDNTTKRGE